jgi:hypothetical protein
MGGMRDRASEYRGWRIAVVDLGRRKLLGHAVRVRSPHDLVMAEGWGVESVAAELRQKIDQAEAELGGDAATSP